MDILIFASRVPRAPSKDAFTARSCQRRSKRKPVHCHGLRRTNSTELARGSAESTALNTLLDCPRMHAVSQEA